MEYIAYIVLVLVVLIMCAYQQQREKAFDRERASWQEERRHLLDRIQAPDAAQVAAGNALLGDREEGRLSEEQRLRRKAEDMGISLDDLRIPPEWGGSGW